MVVKSSKLVHYLYVLHERMFYMARKKTITENISEPKKTDVISGRENYVNIFQKLGFRVLLESGVLIFLVTDYKENDKIMDLLDAHGYKGSYGFRIYKKAD